MLYKFTAQTYPDYNFKTKSTSFEEAVGDLAFFLQAHDEWKVVPHKNGEMGVDILLKNHYVDTLLCSEYPDTRSNQQLKEMIKMMEERIGEVIIGTCNSWGCQMCWYSKCEVERLQNEVKLMEEALNK